MSARTAIMSTAILAFLIALLALSLWNARPIPEEEVARRVSESRPTWQNYPEDIKAQPGARLAAQWQGEPIAAQWDGEEVRVTFRLQGPWADRQQAFPILLEEPLGGVHRNTGALFPEEAPDEVVYVFEIGGGKNGMPLPWLQIKYPHGERRLVLSDGQWGSTSD